MLAVTRNQTNAMTRSLPDLRSRRWFADDGMRGFAHRQRIQQMGLRRQDVLDRPIVAIVNTWSDLSPCHAHLRERAESVKRGVLMAGGYPLELPALSLGEVMVKPTTMLYRNFLAMEVEELLRSLPDVFNESTLRGAAFNYVLNGPPNIPALGSQSASWQNVHSVGIIEAQSTPRGHPERSSAKARRGFGKRRIGHLHDEMSKPYPGGGVWENDRRRRRCDRRRSVASMTRRVGPFPTSIGKRATFYPDHSAASALNGSPSCVI